MKTLQGSLFALLLCACGGSPSTIDGGVGTGGGSAVTGSGGGAGGGAISGTGGGSISGAGGGATGGGAMSGMGGGIATGGGSSSGTGGGVATGGGQLPAPVVEAPRPPKPASKVSASFTKNAAGPPMPPRKTASLTRWPIGVAAPRAGPPKTPSAIACWASPASNGGTLTLTIQTTRPALRNGQRCFKARRALEPRYQAKPSRKKFMFTWADGVHLRTVPIGRRNGPVW